MKGEILCQQTRLIIFGSAGRQISVHIAFRAKDEVLMGIGLRGLRGLRGHTSLF